MQPIPKLVKMLFILCLALSAIRCTASDVCGKQESAGNSAVHIEIYTS